MPAKKRKLKKAKKMPSDPTPSQESMSCEVAQFIDKRHKDIISRWEHAVRCDQKVPTANKLTRYQLQDHIPDILTALSMLLCQAYDERMKKNIVYSAAMHGQIRWQQDYDLSELLREIGHLRRTLIHELIRFQSQMPEFAGSHGESATMILHSYMDRLMRVSVEQFVGAAVHTGKRPRKNNH